MTDTERLDWAEAHPAEFLRLVLGTCPEESDGLRVHMHITGRQLSSGALEIAAPRWDMRGAIDRAKETPNGLLKGARDET